MFIWIRSGQKGYCVSSQYFSVERRHFSGDEKVYFRALGNFIFVLSKPVCAQIMAHFDGPAVPNFDPHESSVSSRSWKKWLRAFELYAAGRGVRDTDQKKALLLYCAGLAVQEIFFTLELEQGTDAYDSAKKTLNSHFETKVNVPYERYCFRQLSQECNESVEEFITRLRQHAAVCEFANVDEQIRDQVIGK